MTSKTLTDLYDYFDHLFDQDTSADTLFASSYVRGFIAVAAVDFGDDSQVLSLSLYQMVSDNIQQAKTELSPQDSAIVAKFWQQLFSFFSANG
jgi:YfcL protein